MECCVDGRSCQVDCEFAERRTELCAKYAERIATADKNRLGEILVELNAFGVRRNLPGWRLKPAPPYPRGVVQSEIGKPKWEGTGKSKNDKASAGALRVEFDRLWDVLEEERSEELRRELRIGLRRMDREHTRALWTEVRSVLDYPVFTAAPECVGITSTGGEGPNELPKVLAALKEFDMWVKGGADEEKTPSFVL